MSASQTDPAKLESQYRILLVLWMAFLSTVVIYLFLSFVLPRPVASENRLLTIIFSGMSVFLVLVSFVVKRKFLSRSIDEQDLRFVRTGNVLAAALCEAAALLGLLDALIAHDRYFYVLIAFAFLGLLLHFPRRSHLQAATFKSVNPLN